MIAYTLVLLVFVWRWKNDKPVKKQIELFSWWPQALRTKSYKRYPHSATMSGGDVTRTNSDVEGLSGQTTRVGSDGSTMGEKVGGFGNSTGLGGAATDKEVRGAKKLLTACLAATLLIFIRYVFPPPSNPSPAQRTRPLTLAHPPSSPNRSIYRTVELLDGWDGKIITNQTLFNVLDGMLIALALGIFVIVHPGFLLPRRDRVREGNKV